MNSLKRVSRILFTLPLVVYQKIISPILPASCI